jgi:NhaP-type Na+/H+ or K+/H+ antiporter
VNEAGLNDGLSVPFLMCFIALAVVEGQSVGAGSVLTRFLGEQLGYGTLIGLGAGLAGGALLGLARRKEWMAAPLTQLGVVAIPLLCVIASEATDASMFIAAFVAGLATQIGFREPLTFRSARIRCPAKQHARREEMCRSPRCFCRLRCNSAVPLPAQTVRLKGFPEPSRPKGASFLRPGFS